MFKNDDGIELIVELDPDGRMSHCDATARAFFGETLASGSFFGSIVDSKHRAAFELALERPTPTTFRWLTQSLKGAREVSWHLVPLADDERLLGVLLSGVAIDERTARITGRLNEMRYALDQACIVAVTDRNGRITHVNDRFCEVSGYNRSELVGRTHRMVNSGHHRAAFFKGMWATIGRGRVWRGQVCNRSKLGTYYWVETTIVPFVDRHGRPYRYMAVRTEITEQKAIEAKLERTNERLGIANERLASAYTELETLNRKQVDEHQRMVQAEKLSSVGLLAAGVAHEINNPLAGALSCIEALRDGRVAETRRDTYFATVMDGLERIQKIVQSLLNYSRPSTAHEIDLAPSELVVGCVRLINPGMNKRRIQLDHRVPDAAVRIVGDRSQLMQAVLNVLLNALHASPEASRIVVDYPERDQMVGIRVSDSGAGFAPDTIDRVTDPFFSTKPEGEGTGLGLAVTLGIVQSHGGELALSNDDGAIVTIWLRRAAASTAGLTPAVSTDKPKR